MSTSLRLRVLGPIESQIDGNDVDLGGPKSRALLAALVANRGRVVTVDWLVDGLWGETAPATARKSIQKYVSGLRKRLGEVIVTQPTGYMAVIDRGALDADLFEDSLKDADAAPDSVIEEALALWRGAPYPELSGTPWNFPEVTRLNELRLEAIETLLERRVESGRHHEAIAELEGLVDTDPYRERVWAFLMLAYYRSGRQSDALAAYQRLRRTLGDELGIEPSPELAQLEEKILLHDPGLVPGPAPVQNNLPTPLTSFVGRQDEVVRLVDLLDHQRLVVLLGTGGSGKTRLATETGRLILDRFPDDGVWFVDLAPTRSPDQVVDAIAKSLGVGRIGDRDNEAVLADFLSGRRILLIMDNCEHLLGRVATVTQRLLEGSPGLKVLATSRERLGIAGETVFDVAPLPYPPEGEEVTEDYDAVHLFMDRVRAVTGDSDLPPDVVGEVVRRLDGIPLALELAAARVRGIGLVALRDHLDDRFSLLASPTGVDRHQTLLEAVDWSFRLLEPHEQVLFSRLSVFRGGFDLSSAADVCGFDPLDGAAIPSMIGDLVDKSLVTVTAEEPRRYHLLETLREYATRVVEPKESARLRDAHVDYFCRFAEDAATGLKGHGQTRWRSALRADQDNFRKALLWADATSPETLVRLAVALGTFWDSVGPRAEGHEWLAKAVDKSAELPAPVRIAALIQASDLYISQNVALPLEYGGRALSEARAIGDPILEGRALRALSWALSVDGRNEEARSLALQAREIFAGQDDPWELALWSERLGHASFRDPQLSISMLNKALDLYRQVGDRSREAIVLYKIAEQLGGSQDDLESALEHARQAVAICDEEGNAHDGCHARLEYGKVLRRVGRHKEAMDVLGEAFSQLTRQGDERCTIRTLTALGTTQLDAGDTAAGEQTLRESLRRGMVIREKRTARTALAGMARVAAEAGSHETAVVILGFVDELGQTLDIPVSETSQGKRDARLAALRSELGEAKFDECWDEGRAMTLDEAIDLALTAAPDAPVCVTSDRNSTAGTGVPESMVTERIKQITASTEAFLSFLQIWEAHRHQPGVSNFAIGNPQEMVIDGFASALAVATTPLDRDHYGYKFSEEQSRLTVAKHLSEWRGQVFDPEDIAMTPGAFGAIAVALGTLVDIGAEVVYCDPSWFFYRPMIISVGAIPVNVPVRSDDHDLDLDRLGSAITEKTRLVLVNTPNNPTGRIYPPATLQGLAGVLTDASQRFGHPIYLLSDEPYPRLVFSDATFTSPVGYYPYTLISYSYGKILLTPGQRIGWLAWSPEMPDREALRSAVFMAQVAGGWQFPSAIMQYSLESLEGLSIDLVELERKRDLMVGAIQDAGYDLRPPEGTFYLWVRSPDPNDAAFAERLAQHGVLVLPGSTCGAPGYFRISLTATSEMIERSLPVFAAAAKG